MVSKSHTITKLVLTALNMKKTFDYGNSGFEVKNEIVNAHRKSWKALSGAGSFWSGKDRVQIAEQARAARLQRKELPFNRSHPSCSLPSAAIETAHTIAADAHKIDKSWAEAQTTQLGSGAYIEIASIVATIAAIDAFSEALGGDYEEFPRPLSGEPSGLQSQNVADIGAYVPMVDPWHGPNVARAFSLVPAANQLFFSNVQQMYTSGGDGFSEIVWTGPLTRPQAELLAARVSSVNECFY